MADWLENLENDLKDIVSNKKSSTTGEVSVKKNNNLILFCVIIALGAGIFATVRHKQSQQVPAWQQQQLFQQQPLGGTGMFQQQNNPHMGVLTTEQKLDVLKKQYENVDLAAQKIWEVTKWNRDRMTLLATLNNHNLVVMQGNHPKSELIFLNSDWTINRMPDRINLDQSDQDFIKKFLKN